MIKSTIGRLRFFNNQIQQMMALPAEQRQVVFYAPTAEHWQHLRPLVVRLMHHHKHHIIYLTSDVSDPAFNVSCKELCCFIVDSGWARKFALKRLKPSVLITTSDELFNFYNGTSAHTIYVQHSMHSLHHMYPKDAFHKFDSIFCSGPHHAQEIRAMELCYGYHKKQLLEHGHGVLDHILRDAQISGHKQQRFERDRKNILVSPCWDRGGISHNVLKKLIASLLGQHYEVTLRVRKKDIKQCGEQRFIDIEQAFANDTGFSFRIGEVFDQTIYDADLMITDWSAVAIDYAFGLECPVLFLDTPKNIRNNAYQQLNHRAMEDAVRHHIGEIVSLDKIDNAAAMVDHMLSHRYEYIQSIIEMRDNSVYNIGDSATTGASYIHKILAK